MRTLPSPASALRAPGRRAALQRLAGGCLVLGAGFLWHQTARPSEKAVELPAPDRDLPPAAGPQKIVLAGGCFWGVQGVYQHVKGVLRAESGYCGGTAQTADYGLVSHGNTGHAESVEVTYDPSQVSYGALLHIFFSVVHDPTQLNRQGPDVGPQYRSAIFTSDPGEQDVAQAYIRQLDASGRFARPIATRLEQARFYPAERYHQDFLEENPHHPYIVYNDLPKIAELKRLFPQRYRNEPVLIKRPGPAGG